MYAMLPQIFNDITNILKQTIFLKLFNSVFIISLIPVTFLSVSIFFFFCYNPEISTNLKIIEMR